jgi:hypothetical protein
MLLIGSFCLIKQVHLSFKSRSHSYFFLKIEDIRSLLSPALGSITAENSSSMVQQLAARQKLLRTLRQFDLQLGTGKTEVARFAPASTQLSGLGSFLISAVT